MTGDAYSLFGALDGASPLVLSSPHSGRLIPPSARRYISLPLSILEHMGDTHVDALLLPAVRLGVPMIAARYSRVVCDVNRAADEFDPAMFAGQLPIDPRVSVRVRQGLGVVPAVCWPGRRIHGAAMPAEELSKRVCRIHAPWHQAVRAGMEQAHARHDVAVLLDMHSMPTLDGRRPAAVVVGDRHGRSAAGWLVDLIVRAFEDEGLKTVRNHPYAGGFGTVFHGQPGAGMHAVQIEIDRALYMNPTTLEPHRGFDDVAATLARVVGRLQAALLPDAQAAE